MFQRCMFTDPRSVRGVCSTLRPVVLTLTLPKRRACEHLPPGEWSSDRMRRLPLAQGTASPSTVGV